MDLGGTLPAGDDATVKVLILDDHQVVREGIRHSLAASGDNFDFRLAATIAEARVAIEQAVPDIAVLDVVLPDGDGIQFCRELRAQHPSIYCVFMTSFTNPRGILSAAVVGASAYLSKDAPTDDLVAAVRRALVGDHQLGDHDIPALLDGLAKGRSEEVVLSQLTAQESRVFELVGLGLSNRQVAERLHLSERTIKNYVSRMLQKLDMNRRTEAAVLAARLAERRRHVNGGPPTTP
jgi:two-component system response regulator DevR